MPAAVKLSFVKPAIISVQPGKSGSEVTKSVRQGFGSALRSSSTNPLAGFNSDAPCTLKTINLPHIYWSVDTRDWETRNTEKVKNAIIRGLKDGAIILLHDIHGTTLSGTREALSYIFANDLDVEFLTVTELLSRDGTPPTPGVTYYNG